MVEIVDKRGANNPLAAQRRAEREAQRQQVEAQATWARQAAGTMWWMAQGQAERGRHHLAARTLAKREELVSGAIRQGIL